MKIKLEKDSYIELYFIGKQMQIVYGDMYFNKGFGYSQCFRGEMTTSNIVSVFSALNYNDESIKDIVKILQNNNYYVGIYKVHDDLTKYYLKQEHTHDQIAKGNSMEDIFSQLVSKENEKILN